MKSLVLFIFLNIVCLVSLANSASSAQNSALMLPKWITQQVLSTTTPLPVSCNSTEKNNQECVYQITKGHFNPSLTDLYLESSMPYALCSDERCTIDANNPHFAICHCKIYGSQDSVQPWQKISVGPVSYPQAKTLESKQKLTSVVSNFSFANSEKPYLCQFKTATAWADCFGVQCSVNGNDEAVCRCSVMKSPSFISMGPKNAAQCHLPPAEVWSSALEKPAQAAINVIFNAYQLFLKKETNTQETVK